MLINIWYDCKTKNAGGTYRKCALQKIDRQLNEIGKCEVELECVVTDKKLVTLWLN